MDQKKLVALYVRVSTARQVDEGYSLEAQEKVLRDEVLKQNKLVFKVYKDAGISGAKADRPGLVALLNDAKRGLFSSVGVWTISRISRNLAHFLWILDELKKDNVTLFSISENFNLSTPIGKFTAQMLGGIAQMQRDSWRENSILGSKLRVKSGKFAGVQMLGYANVPDPNDSKGGTMMVIKEDEAYTVRRIFDLYCDGFGLKAVTCKVNAEGLHGKNGIAFSLNTVHDILTNKAYIGYVKYGGEYFKGVHEPIITLEQWDKAQNLLKSKQHYTRQVDYRYLLSGIIKCPTCGAGMIPWHTRHKNKNGTVRQYYYYCCGRYMNKGISCCRSNLVKAKEADAVVLNLISQYLCDSKWQDMVIAEIRKRTSVDGDAYKQVEQLQLKIPKLRAQKLELLMKYEDGSIAKDELVKEMAKVQKAFDDAEATLQIHNAELTSVAIDETAVREALSGLRTVIMDAGVEDKAKLLKAALKAVYIDSNRSVCAVEAYLPDTVTDGVAQTIKMYIQGGEKIE